MAKKKGIHLAVYNSGGVTLLDGDEVGLFVDSTGALLTSTTIAALTSTTATTTTVADTASSTTILASNANRRGASVSNDSSAVLYLLLGSGTASATNYTVRLAQYGYYEVPYNFTGQLTGIWATDPGDGAARVTEITA